MHVSVGVDLVEEKAVMDWYGSLPPLWASVHIAGGFAMAPIAETSLADFRHQHDLNTVSCFLSCRGAITRIRAAIAAGSDGGRIVNIAARPVLMPTGGMVAYSSAKAAVASMTQSLAVELAMESIWVNAVVPSIIDTPANRKAMPKSAHSAWPKVGEVASAVVQLASPQNASTSGALVPVYGQTLAG